jgi:CheY-like chemotaxis protein
MSETVLEPSSAPMVLVADDEPINLRFLATLLDEEGCRSCLATDGGEALSLIEREPCALLVLDYRMPIKTGLEVLAAVRAGTGPNQRTPAIVLTAETQAREHARLIGGGFARCLVKPVSVRALREVLSLALIRPRPPAAGFIDLNVARAAANHQLVIMQTLRGMLKTELSAFTAALPSADPALLHRIRGACRLTGAMKLEDALRELEQAHYVNRPLDPYRERAAAALKATLAELDQAP